MNDKLHKLSGELHVWSKDEFGSVLKEINMLKDTLKQLREAPGRRGSNREELKIQDKLAELYHREEIMWRQRSRVLWRKEGHRSTRFFNQKAMMTKPENKIKKLCKSDGTSTEDRAEMSGWQRHSLKSCIHHKVWRTWICYFREYPRRS